MALLHISWIPRLNALPDATAWGLIRVPGTSLAPWWSRSWSSGFDGVAFENDTALYAVKQPVGVWRIDFTIDEANLTHQSRATACYPGVQCGMDFNSLLPGWGNPDIVTLHHPYVLATDGDSVYVTGWSGKVYRPGE